MPHAMTEDHSHDDAEGQYRVPTAGTGAAARKQAAEELRLVKSIGDALPAAAQRSSPPVKPTK